MAQRKVLEVKTRTTLMGLLLLLVSPLSSFACPFCSGVSQTFSEEMDTMDVAVICQLKNIGVFRAEADSNPQAEVPKSTFVITAVIKGTEYVAVGDTFQCVYFGEDKKDRPFLAMATDAPNLQWSTPLILTERAEDYLGLLRSLNETRATELAELRQTVKSFQARARKNEKSKEHLAAEEQLQALESELGVLRLDFFQDYLEDEDEMLARDAYDEFAKAPYAVVQALKPKMDHAKLIEFLNDPEVPSNRRRLYFTLLGVCGTKSDAAMLEQFMLSQDRKKKAGLDALIACYLLLTQEEGLAKVEKEFLQNKEAEYSDTYAAIMAIRFHGSEVDVIPRTRLATALHHMLERPELADLVIPDLARWEDWSVIPKLVDLFATADDNSSWVRVPVVNYLRACPLPIAQEKIELLKTIDAKAVGRAMTLFPVTTDNESDTNTSNGAAPADEEVPANTTSQNSEAGTDSGIVNELASPPQDSLLGSGAIAQVNATQPVAKPIPALASAKDLQSVVSIIPPDTLNQVESIAAQGPNFWKLLGVTMLSTAACFFAMRSAIGMTSKSLF